MINPTARIVLVTVAMLAAWPAHAGIPVIDGANLSQNVVTALQSVAMTIKQVEQYRIQLQQYQNMLQNTAAPSTNTWDEAQATMRQLNSSINSLEYYRNQLGSIDNYLARFPDTAAYMNSPCYSPAGCAPEQWAAMAESRNLADQSQKRANDALFRGLDLQQKNMVKDATTLQRLQGSAQGAQGQVEAIGYANQLASHMANQLLQIRGLLIAQQNVIATRNQAQANKEAQEAAAAAQLRKGTGTFQPSRRKSY
ncbi:P-type conjugative transfer protein TrbJ [Geomonas azotofigens]|uniref:P-type conjugative transfer protein TrbJ n=1 Tax=Geomonas azotofigens TaxID=2843196 RepID=UPI001C10583B|nr:P-type conjugative transfer protein TrbJ [Geomonas azotofigens]MBU5612650.1 P-type conjugative transfer protein TrbJ [Geomonas azotofigens]